MAKEEIVPVAQKYTLTITEASAYFNIGIKKMRRLAEENLGNQEITSYCRRICGRTEYQKRF